MFLCIKIYLAGTLLDHRRVVLFREVVFPGLMICGFEEIPEENTSGIVLKATKTIIKIANS